MLNRMIVCLLPLLVVACASTGTEAPAITETAGNTATENSTALPEVNFENEGTSESAQAGAVEVDYDPDEVICKRERQTGSNFSIRTCQTRAEIEARAKADQDIMNVYQRKRACTVRIEGCG